MHKVLCLCSHFPMFELATRVVLVMHRSEHIKTSATGPLALECLPNSELLIHGHKDNSIDLSNLDRVNRRLLFLFPRFSSKELNSDFVKADNRPVTLVVPDGTWRQASRMGCRLPGVEHATHVRLPEGQRTAWGLRKEIRKGELATFEAVARALGIIESPEVQVGMEKFFDVMVARTYKLRGTVPIIFSDQS